MKVRPIEVACQLLDDGDTVTVAITVSGLDQDQAEQISGRLRGPLERIVPEVLTGSGGLVFDLTEAMSDEQKRD